MIYPGMKGFKVEYLDMFKYCSSDTRTYWKHAWILVIS